MNHLTSFCAFGLNEFCPFIYFAIISAFNSFRHIPVKDPHSGIKIFSAPLFAVRKIVDLTFQISEKTMLCVIHALAGNRSQLHFHGGGDLSDQRTLLTHDGVDCGEDCLLERFLVQRW
ncbi:hypothetical protein B5G40_12040 [Flavonifractor sp. An9]|nr:hypothetical protein B5G40_12040 [Flavonifractor sp. An9]